MSKKLPEWVDREYPKPDWAKSQTIRASGLVENICKHGTGHPHRLWLAKFDPDGEKGFGIHGCCGCCVIPEGDLLVYEEDDD